MRVSIIGTGHVGLVTGVCLAEVGHEVLCVDIDERKIADLKQGRVPFYEPGLEKLLQRHANHSLHFATKIAEALTWSDTVFICVGTPQSADGSADLDALNTIVRDIARDAHGYHLVVEKSTVPVRTARSLSGILSSGSSTDAKFEVAAVPEFLREGSAIADTLHPDRIVIGVESKSAATQLTEIFQPMDCPIVITDLATAEIIKHASNSFLAMKISYINAVAAICESTGADVAIVAHAMGLDHRIGSEFLEAGIGYGGSCFPKDVAAFSSVARDAGLDFDLLEVVQQINAKQRIRIVDKIRESVDGLNGRKVAVLGLSFKPNTDDIQESPAVDIVRHLVAEGASVKAYDPQAMATARGELGDIVMYASDAYDAMEGANALVLLTDWEEFRSLDWARVSELLETPLVVDGRNLWDPSMVSAAGLTYLGVGRGMTGRQGAEALS
jgi:UDPglucose 6-dehydrogenase